MTRTPDGRHRPVAGQAAGTRRRFRPLVLVLALALLTGGMVVVSGSRAPAYADEFYAVPSSGTYTIDGKGFGHGRGMSQYGSQGAAVRGLAAGQILAFYYPGTVQKVIDDLQTMRVKLTATESNSIRVDATQKVTLTDLASGAQLVVDPGGYLLNTTGATQTIRRMTGTTTSVPITIGGSGSYAGPFVFSRTDGLSVDGRPYRGSVVAVRTASGRSVAVNYVTLQQYLYGVVPRESPPSWKPAALQAQSVAARSYALRLKQDSAGANWDICDTTACQVYGGRSDEYASTNSAVVATKGIALYYNNGPAFTEFSSSNGGYSTAGSVPYLAARPDPYDGVAANSNFEWTTTLSRAYFESNYDIGTLVGLRVLTRDGRGEWGGRVTSVQVVGSGATVSLSGARFGMKSNWWRPRGANNPFGSIDNGVRVANGQVRFQGWAIDPDTSAALRVHAYVDGRPTAAFTADGARPDVGAVYLGKGDLHGFDFTLNLGQGLRQVCLYAINQGAGEVNTRLGCRSFDLGSAPIGGINSLTLSAGTARLVGWALDHDKADPITVLAYVDGAMATQTVASAPRADVARVYPAAGPNHGFDISVPLTVGSHPVCLYAVDPGPGAGNTKLNCFTVKVLTDPVGHLDRLVGGATTVDVAGWALDTDSPTPTDVRISVDGAPVATLAADRLRKDIGVLYPGTGTSRGFAGSIPVAPGAHDVCVDAVNVGSGTVDTRLGCARVSVGVPPKGGINALTRVVGLQARITGWAIDPDTTGPIKVHVYVNGRASALTANANRPDVGAVFPVSGPAHGFDGVFTLRPGANSVCVYAINVAAGANKALGCRSLTLPATAANPVGAVAATVAPRTINVSGWAVDPDVPAGAVRAHVYLDGRAVRAVTANAARADVDRAYPFYGPPHGFAAAVAATPGRHTVCVYAMNQGGGTGNPVIGCRTVTVPA